MRMKSGPAMAIAMVCFMTSPAAGKCPCWPLAESGTLPVNLPEPTEYTLFAIGVAGLLIGRHLSRKGRTRDK